MFYHVSERAQSLVAAYQKGGVDALRRPTENLCQPPKVNTATLEEARDKILARNAQAEASINIGRSRRPRSRRAGAGVARAKKGRRAGAGERHPRHAKAEQKAA